MNNIPFYSDVIPIVFSVNDHYVSYMAVMMQSIMENSDKKKRYCFFVLYQNIDNNNIDLIKKQIYDFPQFSIEFIDVSQYIKKYNFFVSGYITVETYFRLLIPYLFFEYQKVIYLDGDMICCTDIASLFEIDLNNYALAGVLDWHIISYFFYPHSPDVINIKHKFEILFKLKNSCNYFNGGLIVFNIKLFQETISMQDLFDLAQSREWQFHDQDILNYLFEEKTLLLPFNWNLLINTTYYRLKYLPEQLQNEFNEAEKNPGIIHYKPYELDAYCPHFELFWKYATHTQFIGVIIERMKEKNLITTESFSERIISNIKHRKGISLRFILVDCLKTWLFRDKK
jgi:lipopolysaccharide biosynthesis glycosyltransferase